MTVENTSTFEHAIGAAGRFHLRQMGGSIEIRAVDGEVVRVHERSGKSITEAYRVETADGRLSLTSPDRGGIDLIVFGIGRRASLDVEVEVPRLAEVSIETASGDVVSAGLAGSAQIRTASGDITLRDASGNLEIDAVSGEIEVKGDGPINVRCRTISGDCSLRAPSLGRAVIETTSGDVRVDANLAGAGPFEIHTVSGDATIVGRSGMSIEARTVTGDLRSDLPHRLETGPGRKRLVVGDGGVTLGFKSVSGDLRVSTPRDVLAPTQLVVPAPAVPPSAPRSESPPQAPTAPEPPAPLAPGYGRDSGQEVARLDVLMALERGDLGVEAAMQRLAEIEEA